MDRINYIWIDYIHYRDAKEASRDSILVFNGNISLKEAKAKIDSVKLSYCREYIGRRSNFFSQKGVEVKMAAQNTSTSKVLYEKIIGIL